MSDALTKPRVGISDALEFRSALETIETMQAGFPREGYLKSVLPDLLRLLGGESGGLVRQSLSGKWRRDVWHGEMLTIPETLVSEAVDQGTVQISAGWCVAPLATEPAGSSGGLPQPAAAALAFRLIAVQQQLAEQPGDRADTIKGDTRVAASMMHRMQVRDRHLRRIQQLSAVLGATVQWQVEDDDDDDEKLLHRIADTATELLHSERATIFLWDRRRKKLIGQPALGIEGNRLEVDDASGVVGEVLRSGEPTIWNGDSDDEQRVNRTVDRSLDFQTRSLVAVPMIGHRNETIGVFEAINHRGDGFDSFDAALLADLAVHAAIAIESHRKCRSLTESRDRLVDDAAAASRLIGDDPGIETVRLTAAKVAPTDLTVLILGKNGTGKEVLARLLHYESARRSGPFIAVNCAALVESLLESELFGHEKGAFTDANQTRIGKFELASSGTLFLDEVGDMSPGGQAKLLRVLEEKVVVRVGGSQTIPVDVRVVAATNQPLEQLIAEKKFREDLFFRLNVVSLTLPPLCQRGGDVLLLAEHFLKQFCYQIGRPVPRLEDCAKETLRSHPWPGNIRELRNTIERVCYLCSDSTIRTADLMLSGSQSNGAVGLISMADPAAADSPAPLIDATRRFQVRHIDQAIAACGGNMTEAASRLGLHRSNLYRKMRQLGIPTSGE